MASNKRHLDLGPLEDGEFESPVDSFGDSKPKKSIKLDFKEAEIYERETNSIRMSRPSRVRKKSIKLLEAEQNTPETTNSANFHSGVPTDAVDGVDTPVTEYGKHSELTYNQTNNDSPVKSHAKKNKKMLPSLELDNAEKNVMIREDQESGIKLKLILSPKERNSSTPVVVNDVNNSNNVATVEQKGPTKLKLTFHGQDLLSAMTDESKDKEFGEKKERKRKNKPKDNEQTLNEHHKKSRKRKKKHEDDKDDNAGGGQHHGTTENQNSKKKSLKLVNQSEDTGQDTLNLEKNKKKKHKNTSSPLKPGKKNGSITTDSPEDVGSESVASLTSATDNDSNSLGTLSLEGQKKVKRAKTTPKPKNHTNTRKEKLNTSTDSKEKKPLSGYMLWCNYYRSKVIAENPGIDFSTISKRLGALWQQLPNKEKSKWQRKQKMQKTKHKNIPNLSRNRMKSQQTPSSNSSSQELSPSKNKLASPTATNSPTKSASSTSAPASKMEPVDVAAHLKLLGESLCLIGQKLMEHQGTMTVHGSLSVLLDSTLCALGPLMSLTSQLPEANAIPQQTIDSIEDNIAYFMPGI